MELAIAIGLLILGFVILIKGADFLVDGASSVAKRFNISDMIIGLTIVSFGTSAPEFVISLDAAIHGKNEMILGNVLGSNIYNIILILGTAGVICPLVVQKTTAQRELPFSIFIVLLLFVLANDTMIFGSATNTISHFDGAIISTFFLGFMYYIYFSIKNNKDEILEPLIKPMPVPKSFLYIILGLVGLVYGGNLVVEKAEFLAGKIGMSERIISLTVIAIGTSLPELATSVVAAMKKNSDIAIGNAVGSNIFNILFVLGTCATISPNVIQYNTAANLDIYVLLFVNILLILFLIISKKGEAEGGTRTYIVEKWQAGILLAIAIGYTSYLVVS